MTLTRRAAIMLAAPGMIAVLVLLVIPTLYFLHYSVLSSVHGHVVGMRNFQKTATDTYYATTLARTIVIAAVAALVCAIMSLPLGLLIATTGRRLKAILVILCLFPLLSGSVVRAIGWLAILGYSGPLTRLLMWLHVLDKPMNLAQNQYAVTLVLATILAPVMILVVHAALEDLNQDTVRASLSLGASRRRTFVRVVLPQISPALLTGSTLVFVLSLNSYDTPTLVGGGKVPMMSPAIYLAIMQDYQWSIGAVLTIGMLCAAVLALIVYASVFRSYFGAWRASFS